MDAKKEGGNPKKFGFFYLSGDDIDWFVSDKISFVSHLEVSHHIT
jgi:hypothetical protein